jgi:hypothetical protein
MLAVALTPSRLGLEVLLGYDLDGAHARANSDRFRPRSPGADSDRWQTWQAERLTFAVCKPGTESQGTWRRKTLKKQRLSYMHMACLRCVPIIKAELITIFNMCVHAPKKFERRMEDGTGGGGRAC